MNRSEIETTLTANYVQQRVFLTQNVLEDLRSVKTQANHLAEACPYNVP